MRLDLPKVLTERPRHHRGGAKQPVGSRREQSRESIEEQPLKESMRKPWLACHHHKEFSDLDGPIIRWLHKQVGRRWDDVYSDLSRTVRRTSRTAIHFWSHIEGLVTPAAEVVMVDGSPCYKACGFRVNGVRVVNRFYVDPTNGILRRAPALPKPRREKVAPEFVPAGPMAVYKKLNGIWYRVELAVIPPLDEAAAFYDHCLRRTVTLREFRVMGTRDNPVRESWQRQYGGPYYAIRKQQLSGEEVQRLKLESQN